MKILPIRDQVVVSKNREAEKISQGGIITVSIAPKNIQGTVLAIGSGRITMSGAIVPLEVKVGDKVLFNPSQANEVEVDGETVLILREDALIVLR